MERESGFYWIKIHDDYEWEIARFDKKYNEWSLFGYDYFKDSEIKEIDERRVERSKKWQDMIIHLSNR